MAASLTIQITYIYGLWSGRLMIINNTAPIDNFLPYYCLIFLNFILEKKALWAQTLSA